MEKIKTLQFEGLGATFGANMASKCDVGNYRISTYLVNDEGKNIYLELGFCKRYRFTSLHGSRPLKKPVVTSECALFVLFAHYITGDAYDCNTNKVPVDKLEVRNGYDYTRADVVRFVNEQLHCSFAIMKVTGDYRDGGPQA